MAYSDSKNPFFVDEKDDFSFSHPTRRGYQSSDSKNPFMDDDHFDRPSSRYEQLQKLKEQSMGNQLESTQRALASICDSEQMGVATAEELLQQGEQLVNTEKRLDKINQDMKTSQKHLNSIKSIFGGIKNWWQGKDKLTEEPPQPEKPKSQPAPSLQKALNTSLSSDIKSGPHPALALKSPDGRGFYDDDDDLDSKFLGTGRQHYNTTAPNQQKQAVRSGLAAADDKLEQNLEMMCEGMMRLKGLAKGLGEEIDMQNEQIDRITGKADRADIKLKDQNRQMRQILR